MKKNKTKLLQELLQKQNTRIALCEKSFKHYFLYYFSDSIKYPKLAPFHNDRFKAIEEHLNIFVEWHRECAKTTIMWLALESWKICYWKTRFIANLCYDEKKAKEFNFMLANILSSNQKLKNDFWKLYNKNKKNMSDDEDFMLRSGIGEFTTTTGIKVKAFGSGQTIRGELYIHPKYWLVRPDHLYIDDLDNNKNTKNKTLIAEDISFLNQEVFGGLDANAQIVISGNVIRTDWRNPRLKSMFSKNKRWKVFSNFIFWKAGKETGTPVRSRFVLTDEDAKKINQSILNKDSHVISLETKKANEMSWFLQNWIWSPMTKWQTVIELNQCKKVSKAGLPPTFDYIQIWWDPAFSLKTATDCFWLVVTWHKIIDGTHFKYVLKSIKLSWEEKDQDNVDNTFRQVYHEYKASRIKIESNNWWIVFGRGLQKLGLAVDIVNATRDKLTRLKEFEWDFQRGQIFFLEWETEELVNQLIEFTGEDWNEDDLVDAMVWSFFGDVEDEYVW